jgi:hypothetical protein
MLPSPVERDAARDTQYGDEHQKRATQMREGSFQTQEGRDSAISAKGRPVRCDVEHCGLPAISSIEYHFFCLYHFISHCYGRLEQCKASHLRSIGSRSFEAEDRFLQECAEQAANLVCPLRGFDNLDRARLFDIFLWASELIAKRTGANVSSKAAWSA